MRKFLKLKKYALDEEIASTVNLLVLQLQYLIKPISVKEISDTAQMKKSVLDKFIKSFMLNSRLRGGQEHLCDKIVIVNICFL